MRTNMKKFTAKNPFNQPALDYLYTLSQKPRYSSSDHYPRLFFKGMQSLAKCPLYIGNFQDALSLSGVGNFLAREIMKAVNGDDADEAMTSSPKTVKKTAAKRKQTKTTASPSKSRATTLPTANKNNKSQKAEATNKNKKTKSVPSKVNDSVPFPNPPKSTTVAAKRGKKSATSTNTNTLSTKEEAHMRTTNESIGILTNLHLYKNWKTILLLDKREYHSNAVQSVLLQYSIDCEQRQLPIGDIIWVARGEYQPTSTTTEGHMTSNATNPQPILPKSIEIVLGTIIERKSLADLASSLYGTRFEEQRLRLKHSHSAMDCANQVMFLVEGSNMNEIGNCPAATLRYAMMSTRIHMGFQIIRTKNLEDTCRMLRRIHTRVVARTFTDEMKRWRIRSFHESPTSNKKRRRSRAPWEGPAAFQSTPNIPFERTRHYLYEELKTKIELDRERGTRSIHAIFRAQLKQVESMSVKKVEGISRLYRTPRELMEGYEQLFTEEECDKMVEDIPLGISIARASRVGPKSSMELSYVYTRGGDLRRWTENNEENTNKECALKPPSKSTAKNPLPSESDTTPKRGNKRYLDDYKDYVISPEIAANFFTPEKPNTLVSLPSRSVSTTQPTTLGGINSLSQNFQSTVNGSHFEGLDLTQSSTDDTPFKTSISPSILPKGNDVSTKQPKTKSMRFESLDLTQSSNESYVPESPFDELENKSLLRLNSVPLKDTPMDSQLKKGTNRDKETSTSGSTLYSSKFTTKTEPETFDLTQPSSDDESANEKTQKLSNPSSYHENETYSPKKSTREAIAEKEQSRIPAISSGKIEPKIISTKDTIKKLLSDDYDSDLELQQTISKVLEQSKRDVSRQRTTESNIEIIELD